MVRWRAPLLALVPVVALTIAVPFVNRLDPTFLGLPFVALWIIAWVLLTPLFLWFTGRLERRW
ncbi:MAG: DUF3311 domain-containing protein [Candidatus Tyrphobacter sp.]